MSMRITKTLTALALVVACRRRTAVAMPPLEPVLGAKAFAPRAEASAPPTRPRSSTATTNAATSATSTGATGSSATAIGSGRRATGPQTTVAIELRAHDLGSCAGSQRRAYRHLAFRQRTRSGKFGPWHDWAGGHSICSQP